METFIDTWMIENHERTITVHEEEMDLHEKLGAIAPHHPEDERLRRIETIEMYMPHVTIGDGQGVHPTIIVEEVVTEEDQGPHLQEVIRHEEMHDHDRHQRLHADIHVLQYEPGLQYELGLRRSREEILPLSAVHARLYLQSVLLHRKTDMIIEEPSHHHDNLVQDFRMRTIIVPAR